jgi:hypothetical protein
VPPCQCSTPRATASSAHRSVAISNESPAKKTMAQDGRQPTQFSNRTPADQNPRSRKKILPCSGLAGVVRRTVMVFVPSPCSMLDTCSTNGGSSDQLSRSLETSTESRPSAVVLSRKVRVK